MTTEQHPSSHRPMLTISVCSEYYSIKGLFLTESLVKTSPISYVFPATPFSIVSSLPCDPLWQSRTKSRKCTDGDSTHPQAAKHEDRRKKKNFVLRGNRCSWVALLIARQNPSSTEAVAVCCRPEALSLSNKCQRSELFSPSKCMQGLR